MHTSHHTHYVIGTGADDPQKYDPTASRETLDHSIPYIFAVALQDGAWHHEALLRPGARQPARHRRAVAQGHHAEDPEWTRRYHSTTRPRRRSAAASRSRSPTADDRRRDRRRRRASARAPGRSAGPSTSASSARLAERRARPGRAGALPRRWPSGCPSWTPASWRELNLQRRRAWTRRPTEGAVLMLPLGYHRRREARGAPRRPGAQAGCCGSRARSTRCPPGSSQDRASRASTSRAPCSPPTRACPTSASPR